MRTSTFDVAIIGAGIAGLAAAISMRRSGHDVTVYERSSFKMEVGAAINMPPQAVRIMRAWDLPTPMTSTEEHTLGQREPRSDHSQQSTFGGTILSGTQRVNFKTGQPMPGQKFDEIAEQYGAPFVSYHRADLHALLRTKAEELGAHIRLKSNVVDIDCRAGALSLSKDDASLEEIKHDLLIIADGINTSFILHAVGHDVPLNREGRMCFRTLIPTSKILANKKACSLYTSEDGAMTGFDGVSGSMNPQTGVMFIQYPCRGGELMNVAVFDKPREDRVHKEDWNSPATIEDALEPLSGFHEGFRALVRCADGMRAFTIALREPLPTYVNGRAVLIGDAAHPMLPSLAGGGSTSLEDAATLGVLFSDVSQDASLETVTSRLALYNAVRRPRDATQQVISNTMFKPQPASSLKDKIGDFYGGHLPDKVLGGWTKETCEFVCGYDVFVETEKAMRWAEERQWKDIDVLPDGLVQHFGDVKVAGLEENVRAF